ncbi:MAG: FAD-dependent oxidoreductase [Tepidisphaerales bacterium]
MIAENENVKKIGAGGQSHVVPPVSSPAESGRTHTASITASARAGGTASASAITLIGSGDGTVGAVMVVGGGITGIQASLDLAESGFKVYLVDSSPVIGGKMAQLDKTFPTGDCSMCILSPKLVECARNRNIEIITLADVQSISGEAGQFLVEVRRRPRYVDEDKCNACGDCVEACPVSLPNEFDRRLGTRKAIFRPYPQAIPNLYGISKAAAPAPCRSACPAGVNAQGYVALIAAGKIKEAYDLVRKRCPLPAVCGRICHHPCQDHCNRIDLGDEPVAVRDLKRFAADYVHANRDSFPAEPVPAAAPRKEKVAIIGGGPAGLTAAHDLSTRGYEVTIFESRPFLGGMLRLGVPAYRLPREVLDYEIEQLVANVGSALRTETPSVGKQNVGSALWTGTPPVRKQNVGSTLRTETPPVRNADPTPETPPRIEVRLNTKLGADITIDGLRQQGFAATFIATGAHKSKTLSLPGDSATGVVYGLDFLCKANLGESVPVGRKAVVMGGGNVAMDAARAALRLGAAEVTIVYRRGRAEMPALPEEIQQAEEEGVRFELLTNPIRVIASADGSVSGLECLRMTLGEPDASGRRRPVPVEGSNFTLAADTVIFAIGQEADLAGVPLTDGKIAADKSLATVLPGVFAGGDVVLGPASLVEAMAHGHRAAEAIQTYLGRVGTAHHSLPNGEQRDAATQDSALRTQHSCAPNPDPSASSKPRQPMPEAVATDRLRDFREISLGYTREQAMAEAGRCLACGLCSECGLCVKACAPGAIIHDMLPVTRMISVGSVILTPGFDEFRASLRGEFGHGRYANVLSSVQFERMLSAAGPTSGQVLRPSDGKHARNIAFIQCVGSRDVRGNGVIRGNGVRNRSPERPEGCCAQTVPDPVSAYCSSICCMSATKEAMVAMEHEPGLSISIFCMDIRAFGKEFDAYVTRARDEHGVKFIRAIPSRVVEMPGSRNARIRYFDDGGKEQQQEFDMVVLSVGMRPSDSVKALAERLGLSLNEFGFCQTDRLAPMTGSKPGLYVAGAFQEPKDIPESVAQASAAASCAMEQLASARGTMIQRHAYPWERDVSDEKPRIGVFICHCGHNIASVVDVQTVAARASKLPNVAHAEANLYTCSDNSLQHIKDVIREQRLNRVVVASCSPRTHEPLFQETLRESGLNPYLFTMTNIRDQCSWVHREAPAAATEKAIDLMTMAVARARHLKALETGHVSVTQSALVIGGGLAGMTAALAVADQGFQVHLLEKEPQLGGNLRHIHNTLERADVRQFLATLVQRVQSHPRITVYLRAKPANIAGHVGSFKTRIQQETGNGKPAETLLSHGVTIIATGGAERQTNAYLHGQHPAVVTQRELEKQLAAGTWRPSTGNGGDRPTVVMIQCVESRNAAHPYCSRVCCTEAVKNALEIKRQYPGARVFVLAKDIRTYGFRETRFEEARKQGILFIRHPETQDPVVTDEAGKLAVRVVDAGTGREVLLQPDTLALSVGIAPGEDNTVLSPMLRTALTADGFFLEAHPKLRPVDLANEGEFICGLAHSPRFIDETIAQAKAAAGRAATVLSKTALAIAGQIARVNPDNCVACATCVRVCPYGGPAINDLHKAQIQGATCMGCGSCVAACPARAITLQHQEDRQVSAMLDELLLVDGGVS